MRMNAAQIKQTLTQYEAEEIAVDHPLMPRLVAAFGDHTYFLDGAGLNIVEPKAEGRMGVVVNLASWTDPSKRSLQQHAPEETETVVTLNGETQ